MSNYTATGVPEDATKYIPEDIRDEFELIESAIASKADSAGTTSVSTTSLTIGAATHNFTMEASKNFIPGMTIYLADSAAPGTNSMWGCSQHITQRPVYLKPLSAVLTTGAAERLHPG